MRHTHTHIYSLTTVAQWHKQWTCKLHSPHTHTACLHATYTHLHKVLLPYPQIYTLYRNANSTYKYPYTLHPPYLPFPQCLAVAVTLDCVSVRVAACLCPSALFVCLFVSVHVHPCLCMCANMMPVHICVWLYVICSMLCVFVVFVLFKDVNTFWLKSLRRH